MSVAPRTRQVVGGRPKIGPKVQFCVPEEEHDYVLEVMGERKMSMDDWPDMLREVFALGIGELRRSRAEGVRA